MDKTFDFKTHRHNVDFTARFMKKIYRISAWLNHRYDLKAENVVVDQFMTEENKLNDQITIRLIFNEKEG